MGPLSRLADWWDSQQQQSEQILGQMVQDHPNMGAILAATATSTAMQLGRGFVDVLRLGDGVVRGGWRGYGADVLRLLMIAGPAFRGARVISARIMELRFLSPISSELGVCSWVASTQAMRMTGRLFMSIDDLLAFNAFPNLRYLYSLRCNTAQLRQIGAGAGTFLRDIVQGMRILGARVTQLPNPTSMAAVEAATTQNGVVLFNIRWFNGGELGHTLTAFRNAAGQFRILDRSGAVVRNLTELDNLNLGYPQGISSALVYDEMYFIADTIVTQIAGGISTIAMEVTSVNLAQAH